MNVNHHQTKRERSYFEWGDNMQIIRKGKGKIAMTRPLQNLTPSSIILVFEHYWLTRSQYF